MEEGFFDRLLCFPTYWIVEKIEHEEDTGKVFIYVKFDSSEYKAEHADLYFGLHDYNEYRTWRHLDILQYKTYIKAKLPRIKDKTGKINTLKPTWSSLNNRHSYLFEEKVIDTLLTFNFTVLDVCN